MHTLHVRAQQALCRGYEAHSRTRCAAVRPANPVVLRSESANGCSSSGRRTHLCRANQSPSEAVGRVLNDSVSSIDVDELYDTSSMDCPHGNVIGIMRSSADGVLTCTPEEKLTDIIPKLNKVTGLPVLDKEGKVMGVISRKDVIKVRKGMGSMTDTVSQHMTAPAIVVPRTATVQQAADLMLGRKIRRLPVVDEEGYPVGIVARTDIFKPLFREAYDLYMEKEKAALKEASGVVTEVVKEVVKTKKDKKPPTWKIKYLYDGDCAMCQSLMAVLKRQDNSRGLIKFVNIADPNYAPKKHMGITYEEAMDTIHAIQVDGTVLMGTDALKALFDTVGLGWATKLSDLPGLNKVVDATYNFLSANRISLGGAMDAIIAAKRVDMSKQGVQTCSDVDEECVVEW
mmetsp:Transcript_21371/g.46741  ORF Transcript_21371/g.46741 Transcript_21371/m.46741 type:complete len:400 (+) Transcript_21371:151-1350(+)